MTEQQTELLRFLEQYGEHYRELLKFLAVKQGKVAADDTEWLLDSLTEEQRLVMQSGSLENKRITLMNSCGYENFTSSRLLEVFPAEAKGNLRKALDVISASVYYITETNQAIREIIERRMDVGEDLDVSVTGTATYSPEGRKKRLPGNDDFEVKA